MLIPRRNLHIRNVQFILHLANITKWKTTQTKAPCLPVQETQTQQRTRLARILTIEDHGRRPAHRCRHRQVKSPHQPESIGSTCSISSNNGKSQERYLPADSRNNHCRPNFNNYSMLPYYNPVCRCKHTCLPTQQQLLSGANVSWINRIRSSKSSRISWSFNSNSRIFNNMIRIKNHKIMPVWMWEITQWPLITLLLSNNIQVLVHTISLQRVPSQYHQWLHYLPLHRTLLQILSWSITKDRLLSNWRVPKRPWKSKREIFKRNWGNKKRNPKKMLNSTKKLFRRDLNRWRPLKKRQKVLKSNVVSCSRSLTRQKLIVIYISGKQPSYETRWKTWNKTWVKRMLILRGYHGKRPMLMPWQNRRKS